jgi:hypothetical protein
MVDRQILDHMQNIAGRTAATRIGAQTLHVVDDERLAHGLISVFAILLMLRAWQQARDDPARVIVEKRLKRAPAPVAVERNAAHHALGEQIAHHERHVNSHTRAAVICFQSGKAVGADGRHHFVKRGFGLGTRPA